MARGQPKASPSEAAQEPERVTNAPRHHLGCEPEHDSAGRAGVVHREEAPDDTWRFAEVQRPRARNRHHQSDSPRRLSRPGRPRSTRGWAGGVDSRPVHGQQQRIRIQCGLRQRAGPRLSARVSSQPLQLLRTARIAEHHVMAGPREDRAELARPSTPNPGCRSACSEAGPLLQGFGVPRALDRNLRGGVVDFAEVVRRERDGNGSDVLVEALPLPGAGDGHDPRLLGQQPGERDLGGCRLLPLGDPLQQLDQGLIRLPGLRREARDDVAEVGAVERRVLVDLAREEALAQRAEGDEADPELLERGRQLLFRSSPPRVASASPRRSA